MQLDRSRRLRKEIGLLGVYAISTGTTLSAGFFLLPGLAAREAGPALVLCYLVAVIPLLPAMFSITELATAMPRAGGVYYFLDRTLGPAVGTIGGLGTWLVLVLKVAFALVGIGAYIAFFRPDLPVMPLMVGVAVLLSVLNVLGAGKTGGFQLFLVGGLLTLLVLFVGGGVTKVDPANFRNFLGTGASSILATAGLVYVSYIGITKVASLSEEVKDPERNLPRGIFLSLATTVTLYVLGTGVMVGVVPMERLAGDLTPAATAAEMIFGHTGAVLISIAALFAFTSVANAGILSASRYPLAMSRDHLLPRFVGWMGWRRSPVVSVTITALVIVLILVTLNPAKIAKLASAFQLLMFALVCVAVIVMRESGIEAYDPGYRSPFYPWMQIIGIIAPLFFIAEMGLLPLLFSIGLILAGFSWYRWYGRARVAREGAILHVFERLGRQRYEGLDRELRGIMKEKGLREEDPFDEIVARALVLDIPRPARFEEVAHDASMALADRIGESAASLKKRFLHGTQLGATPVTHGVALPHLRVAGLGRTELVVVRARRGVAINLPDVETGREVIESVRAMFFVVSPNEDPAAHLRILAQIAGRVEDENFAPAWNGAAGEEELREVLLRDERYLTLRVETGGPNAEWIGSTLGAIAWPEGVLVALVRRGAETIIPRGGTVLAEGDRLTVIGNPQGIRSLLGRTTPVTRGAGGA